MKTVFKNLGKTVVYLGSTIIQLIATILRGVGLIFEIIGLSFRRTSDILMNVRTILLERVGLVNAEVTETT